MKHDYRRMCVNASALDASTPRSAWLCFPFALSTLTDGAFSCACDHEHTMGPHECDEIVHLIDDLSLLLEAKRRDAMATARASAAAVTAGAANDAALAATAAADAHLVAELNERTEELLACGRHLDLYVRHMLRKALSHTITPSLLDALKEDPTAMHMIVDYKQKVLPNGHRETQTAAFGKKGKSLHGATCLRWDPVRGDFRVLNVRVVCNDSNQTWFHTLAAIRTTVDRVTDVWTDIAKSSLQSDGAGNYDCTAFMESVKDTFKASGIQLTRHVVTEVGDGKNLVDQSFQTAQQDMDAARDGGMDLLDARGILDALETGKALGTINVGMDLGTRALEPKKGPSPLKGIDSLYDREYEYDESGSFTGVRVRQFFRMGAGRLVSKAELRQLWQAEFDASAVQPTLMLPSGGARTAEDKLKLSQPHNLEHFQAKRAKANAREQRRLMAGFEALAAEAQRISERKTYQCQFIECGCRYRSFLTPRWAAKHSAACTFHPDKAAEATVAAAHLRLEVGGPVHLSLAGSGRVGKHGGGSVAASISLIGSGARAVARVSLSTRRPLIGPAYGLQAHRAVHELSTVQAKADAVATRPKDVRARLSIDAATGHVELVLSCRRPPPEMRLRGWAIRPPPSTERYTAEQRSYLAELYAWPEGRLNEEQAFQKFKVRFAADDGPYARRLRLDRAQIKAWFSSEKQRQKKQGARAALAAALPDDEGGGGGDGGEGDGDGGGGGAARQKPNVAAMRSEMQRLGYAAEAKAAKGAKAVLAALQLARAAPRAAAPAAPAAPAAAARQRRPAVAASSSDEAESAAEESEEEESDEDDEYFEVEDVLGMRKGPPRAFLVRWAGYTAAADTWEPESNLLPSLVREYLESTSPEKEAEEPEKEAEEAAAVTEQEESAPPVTQDQAAATTGQKRKQSAAAKQPSAGKQPSAVPKQSRAKRPAREPAPEPAPAKAPRPPPRGRVVAPPVARAPKRARDAEPAARPKRSKKP